MQMMKAKPRCYFNLGSGFSIPSKRARNTNNFLCNGQMKSGNNGDGMNQKPNDAVQPVLRDHDLLV